MTRCRPRNNTVYTIGKLLSEFILHALLRRLIRTEKIKLLVYNVNIPKCFV